MGLKVTIYRYRRALLLLFVLTAVFLLFKSRSPADMQSMTTPPATGKHTAHNHPAEHLRKEDQKQQKQEEIDTDLAKNAAMQFVRSSLRKDRMVVFSKSTCPFCNATKAVLEKYRGEGGLRYTVIEVDLRKDMRYVKHALDSAYSRSTFPSVFIDSQCIGGNDDVQRLEGQGILANMLAEKGLISVLAPATKQPELDRKEQQNKKDDLAAGRPQQSSAEVKIRQLIKKNRVMVFSKTYCPYSSRAKRLLSKYRNERGLDFSVLEADRESDPNAVKEALGRISAQFTFPNIFIDGQSIGGSDDLVQKHQNGELAALLRERGLIV
ncbi:thioredoxin-like protein [Coemansia spiralis]|nr:thioredoxin-like protein [Coemansia spiralis]